MFGECEHCTDPNFCMICSVRRRDEALRQEGKEEEKKAKAAKAAKLSKKTYKGTVSSCENCPFLFRHDGCLDCNHPAVGCRHILSRKMPPKWCPFFTKPRLELVFKENK